MDRWAKEELLLLPHHDCRKNDQQNRLDNLAVRMCGKDLIEKTSRDMKNDRHQNITVGLEIQPVH